MAVGVVIPLARKTGGRGKLAITQTQIRRHERGLDSVHKNCAADFLFAGRKIGVVRVKHLAVEKHVEPLMTRHHPQDALRADIGVLAGIEFGSVGVVEHR
jgi:hypothetical protein